MLQCSNPFALQEAAEGPVDPTAREVLRQRQESRLSSMAGEARVQSSQLRISHLKLMLRLGCLQAKPPQLRFGRGGSDVALVQTGPQRARGLPARIWTSRTCAFSGNSPASHARTSPTWASIVATSSACAQQLISGLR